MAAAGAAVGAGTLCGNRGVDRVFDGAGDCGAGGCLACGWRSLRGCVLCRRCAQCPQRELAADERSTGGDCGIGTVHGCSGTDLGRGDRAWRCGSVGLLCGGRRTCWTCRQTAGPQSAGERTKEKTVNFHKNDGGRWGEPICRRCALLELGEWGGPHRYEADTWIGY